MVRRYAAQQFAKGKKNPRVACAERQAYAFRDFALRRVKKTTIAIRGRGVFHEPFKTYQKHSVSGEQRTPSDGEAHELYKRYIEPFWKDAQIWHEKRIQAHDFHCHTKCVYT